MEKRGWITWFSWKSNKVPRQGVCTTCVRPPAPAWIAEGAPPWAPSLESLRSPGQISRLGEPLHSKGSAWKGEGGRRRKRERVDTGGSQISKKLVRETGLRNWSVFYFPGKLFVLLVVHRDQWINQSYAGSAAPTLIKTRLSFCKSFCIQRVSGALHYLLAKRPVNILWLSSLMNVNLIFPVVFFLNLHHLQSTR